LLSAFEKLDLKINDVSVSQNPSMYGYRSYIQNLVSFSEDSKQTNLSLSGWITDNYGLIDKTASTEPSSVNEAQLARGNWFRENLTEGNKYSNEGYTFMAPLKVFKKNSLLYTEAFKSIANCILQLFKYPNV